MGDPIKIELAGVAQAQVNKAAGFTMPNGLRALWQQDPEVFFIGEVRDADAAAISFQAALIGQLAVTNYHAPSAASTINRLHDMGIRPYVLRSGIRAILNQRLARRLCECKTAQTNPPELESNFLAKTETAFQSIGCETSMVSGRTFPSRH